MFNLFPYTNFHELNLDWIIKKIKKAVYSVNGQLPDTTGNINLEVTSGVTSVNGQNGNVVLDAADVGALPDSYTPPVQSVNGETGNVLLNWDDVHAVARVNDIAPDADGNVDVGTVKSVNNTLPDSNGNVNLPTVSGVTSVCGVGADAQGNVQLSASDVDALPDSYTPPVQSVNGETGAVVLSASDVGALPDSYNAPVQSVNNKTGAVVLSASDVGALPDSYSAPVQSVNNKTGAVVLSASDVGALPDTYTLPDIDYGLTGTIQVNGTSVKTYSITFNKTFESIPTVIACFVTGSTNSKFGLCVLAIDSESITTTGCTFRLYNNDNTLRAPAISWIAIAPYSP